MQGGHDSLWAGVPQPAPEATAAALRGGWIHTGDIGRFDEDGFLYILDRQKDMLISGGANICTAEIERVLIGLPGPSDLAVIGVPDDRRARPR